MCNGSMQYQVSNEIQGYNYWDNNQIINISLTTGQYLDEWKIAVVRALTKGPNLDTEYKNYCPITNLSFMSKLIEKAAQTQLMTHFTE